MVIEEPMADIAAPVENFIDPDCVEEDMVIEEPMADIEAEFGLSEPSLRVDFGANNDAECEDGIPEPSPEPTTAVEECEDGDSDEQAPEINFRIEPAHVLSDLEIIGEEQELPAVEECEE